MIYYLNSHILLIVDYPDIKKFFYIEHPDAANRRPDEVAYIRQQNNNISINDLNEGTCRQLNA